MAVAPPPSKPWQFIIATDRQTSWREDLLPFVGAKKAIESIVEVRRQATLPAPGDGDHRVVLVDAATYTDLKTITARVGDAWWALVVPVSRYQSQQNEVLRLVMQCLQDGNGYVASTDVMDRLRSAEVMGLLNYSPAMAASMTRDRFKVGANDPLPAPADEPKRPERRTLARPARDREPRAVLTIETRPDPPVEVIKERDWYRPCDYEDLL